MAMVLVPGTTPVIEAGAALPLKVQVTVGGPFSDAVAAGAATATTAAVTHAASTTLAPARIDRRSGRDHGLMTFPLSPWLPSRS
jgi:hypothetical protein